MTKFFYPLIFILYVVEKVRGDYHSFSVGQSLCGQYQAFIDAGEIQPPIKEPPPTPEKKCAWYFTDKSCVRDSGSNCVSLKTCKELGLVESKSGRSAKSQTGSAVYSVKPSDDKGVKWLQSLEKEQNLDFFTPPLLDKFAQFRMPNQKAGQLIPLFKTNNIEYKLEIPDVQKYFDEERKEREARRQSKLRKGGKGEMTWDEYYNLTEIYDWLDKLTEDYPELAKVESIGQTEEEREIKMIKICKGECGQKPGVIIDAGLHGREWAAVTTGTYVLNQLLLNSSQYSNYLDKMDFYIIPVLNPDGFDYTWTTDRLWRKNRSPPAKVANCTGEEIGHDTGVDLNRNFGDHWNQIGNDEVCNDGYPGPEEFSEKETVALRDFVLGQQKNGVKFIGYTSLHAYIGMWLIPPGWTDQEPDNWNETYKLAQDAVKAIYEVDQKDYQPLAIVQLGPFTGSSIDWMKFEAGVRFCNGIEVRPVIAQQSEGFEFSLPTDQIIPCGEEVWVGIQVALDLYLENLPE